jgi:hypothetical protein
MNQSTIYLRHKQRRAKTYALKDDTRPGLIRVASGLPLLNLVFPPYQPTIQPMDEPPTLAPSMDMETVYTAHSSSENSEMHSPHIVARIVFASALGGGAAQWFLGRSHGMMQSTVPGVAASPFQGTTTLHSQGILALTSSHHHETAKAFTKAPVPAGLAPIATAAAAAALLFGTKSLIANLLGDNLSDPFSMGFVVSSAASGAVAGTMCGAVKAVQSHATLVGPHHKLSFSEGTASLFRSRASLGRTMLPVLGQHMVGATLFFSSYQALKSNLTWGSEEPPSCLAIGLSGAFAGAVYRGLTSGGMLPVILRAMPQNAILFLGYEAALKLVMANDRK